MGCWSRARLGRGSIGSAQCGIGRDRQERRSGGFGARGGREPRCRRARGLASRCDGPGEEPRRDKVKSEGAGRSGHVFISCRDGRRNPDPRSVLDPWAIGQRGGDQVVAACRRGQRRGEACARREIARPSSSGEPAGGRHSSAPLELVEARSWSLGQMGRARDGPARGRCSECTPRPAHARAVLARVRAGTCRARRASSWLLPAHVNRTQARECGQARPNMRCLPRCSSQPGRVHQLHLTYSVTVWVSEGMRVARRARQASDSCSLPWQSARQANQYVAGRRLGRGGGGSEGEGERAMAGEETAVISKSGDERGAHLARNNRQGQDGLGGRMGACAHWCRAHWCLAHWCLTLFGVVSLFPLPNAPLGTVCSWLAWGPASPP